MKSKKNLLKLKRNLLIASINLYTFLFTEYCNEDSRIENIDDYYLLRVANDTGCNADIVEVDFELRIWKSNINFLGIQEGMIKNYSENYYENGIASSWNNFSPIQLIPYKDIVKKDTYYKKNVDNNDKNHKSISKLLSTYAFPTHAKYKFKEKNYEYICHLYEIENNETHENRYVIGYPMINDEKNPTQIYNLLNASFEYLEIYENATLIPSEIDNVEFITLDEAREILKEYNNTKKLQHKK